MSELTENWASPEELRARRTPMTDPTPDVDIEAVLSAHEYLLTYKTGGVCTCGHVPTVDSSTLQAQQDYHRSHVATALRAALAEVTT